MLPLLHVHKTIRKFSCSDEHYARLTHAAWNTIMDRDLGCHQLGQLREDDNRELLTSLHEAQEELGTAIAKKNAILLFASPATCINFLKMGYEVQLHTLTRDGNRLPYCLEAQGVINRHPALSNDSIVSWRPLHHVPKKFKGKPYGFSDVPQWVRCKLCSHPCHRLVETCPFLHL